jgi:hypothetical protein
MNETPNDPTHNTADEHSRVFHLDHVLYAIAVFVSAVTTFGETGILPGVLIPVAWACVFYSRSRPTALGIVCAVSILCACLIAMLLPAVQSHRTHARRSVCKSNLKQIGLALHNYHDIYGSFPPAYIADENGKPMHSWRVLILPFIDLPQLYEEYSFDEPWDGPNNSKLASKMPPTYACPSSATHRGGRGESTSYMAVVGPHTSWPGATGRKFDEFPDGLSNTILVVESNSGITPRYEL